MCNFCLYTFGCLDKDTNKGVITTKSRESNLLPYVKDRMNIYKMESISCYEKPQSIAIGTIDEDFAVFYIMLIKLAKSYCFDSDTQIEYIDEMINKLLFDKFGVESIGVKVSENLNAIIKQLIDSKYPVVVPINLYRLFYSGFYLIDDWSHVLVVKGYDDKRRIYHILDSIQCNIEDELQRYQDFAIKYEDLELCLKSFKGDLPWNSVFYYKKERDVDKTQILIWMLKVWADAIEKRQYMQPVLHKYIFREVEERKAQGESTAVSELITSNKVSIWSYMNITKYKEVLINELIGILERYEETEAMRMKLESIGKRLSKVWGNYTARSLIRICKLDYELQTSGVNQKINKSEDELAELLQDIIHLIEASGKVDDSITEEVLCQFENNQDRLITRNKEGILFYFHNNKVYNSWVLDYCPKVILSNSANIHYITVKFKVLEESKTDGFTAGIFIRDSYGKIICWSLDQNNRLICDLLGKKRIMEVKNKKTLDKEIELIFQLQERKLFFGERLEGQDCMYGNVVLDTDVLQAGLMCKTWDNCKRLKVIFYNWDVR